ncbi:MAG: hypothetical protein ABI874_12115, partial [Chloroflexota bacterium]
LVFALCLLLLGSGVAFAHKPIFVEPRSNTTRETATPIADADVSWAVYAQLSEVGEVNYYTFTGKRGMEVEIAMSVPKIDSTRDFGVTVALLGKGFSRDNPRTPFALRDGEGFVSAPDSAHDEMKVFNEEFTGTVYWTRQTLRATLPADDTYTIAVYNERGQLGKYVLAIGEREEFGVQDLLDFPRVRSTVQQWFVNPLEPQGAYTHADSATFDATWLLVGLAGVALGLAVVIRKVSIR